MKVTRDHYMAKKETTITFKNYVVTRLSSELAIANNNHR